MEKMYYENQGSKTYLVYMFDENDCIDTTSLEMLTNNHISGLIKPLFTQENSQKYLKYDVSRKITVDQYFMGPVRKKSLLGVFNGVITALLSCEDYMLEQKSVVIDPKYIFADVSSGEAELISLPLLSDFTELDIHAFFKTIMFTTQFDQTENCDHVAKIINYLNGASKFSLVDFKKVLDEIDQAPQPAFVTKKVQEQQTVKETVHTTVNMQQPTAPSVQQPNVPVQPIAPVQPVVPQQPAVPVVEPKVQNQDQPKTDEKKMTFMYLMQHYNKDNAALYKAQKEAKKAEKPEEKAKPKNKKDKKEKKSEPVQDFGFAIPGQPTPAPKPVQPEPKPVTPPVKQPVQSAPVNRQEPQVNQVQSQPYIPREQVQGRPMNFGETTVLGGKAGETTVLTAAANTTQMIAPHLIRSKNNEKISVNKPVFRIGKERSYVDYFIGDNTAVSRSHANIITREGQYFIVDTNSTNHTYVNGMMIQSNTEVEIHHGDMLRFGNDDFEFRVY